MDLNDPQNAAILYKVGAFLANVINETLRWCWIKAPVGHWTETLSYVALKGFKLFLHLTGK